MIPVYVCYETTYVDSDTVCDRSPGAISVCLSLAYTVMNHPSQALLVDLTSLLSRLFDRAAAFLWISFLPAA